MGTEEEILSQIRELVCMIPGNNEENDAYGECEDDLNRDIADAAGYNGEDVYKRQERFRPVLCGEYGGSDCSWHEGRRLHLFVCDNRRGRDDGGSVCHCSDGALFRCV